MNTRTLYEITAVYIKSYFKGDSMEKWEQLISIMQDKEARDDERDDAIIDLYEFNNDIVINALLEEALDDKNENTLRASCGETLAQIWINNSDIDFSKLIKLRGSALNEVLSQIKHSRKDWYFEYMKLIEMNKSK
ncbi:hypothetical protein [Cohnella sp. WQ 127256]|uniref:hypothetical protein n=1 Tax=Cohnella sp. WQ 127256 TaxID=2938790 RepID=UPI002117C2D2|nr:hypothetical protein [Cohnella sp. WQ 127256]